MLDSLRIRPRTEAEWLGPFPVTEFFDDPSRPLEVDLGSGKGRFLLARAAKHPELNFLGIDRMLRRIRKVDNRARRLDLANIRLFRCEGYYAVTYLLPPASVDAIYVFFPDPWPKARHESHRIFNEPFLDSLHRALKPGAVLHFATDHAPYFDAVSPFLSADPRFVPAAPYVPPPDEQTDFEAYYIQSKHIHRLSLRKR